MKILVLNCGSSSIKYKLFDFPSKTLIGGGAIERISEKKSHIKNHHQGIELLISDILGKKMIASLKDISAIGHRVVHGGETFQKPRLIDNKVVKKIKECIPLAPLHNPVNLEGIMSCKKLFPTIPQVAVFDTAFHQSIPKNAYLYALPYAYYKKHKVRRYGFHGTSHQFVTQKTAELLKKPLSKIKLITCHLGNGCSITAINKGKSVDTSMGFTPLEGLVMGTRSGDIDPAVLFYIMKKENISSEKMNEILNKKSGLLGISAISNDFRTIRNAMKKKNQRARLAYELFIYRIEKYIGAYWLVLGNIDAICLTGGIGENSPDLVKRLKKTISKFSGKDTKLLVVPTNEELMIAKLTHSLIAR